jgi:2-polyprenyl-3-methyl-5-hydroxy-6-metoxy-1,4-benzoquinol methylase
MIPDFSIRANIAELMDDPACDTTKLLRTIRQFESINRRVARFRTILRRWILADMITDPGREYHLVDMGAGGCDIDVWLLRAARKHGLLLRITACDIDERTLAHARSSYGNEPGLHIQKVDVLADGFDGPVDYVFANHFLHHLADEAIIRLLQLWQPRIRRKMVFSDLQRNPASYLGYSALGLLYPGGFARTDGLISIRRGFQPDELAALARASGVNPPFSVHRLAPGRLVLCIDGSPPRTGDLSEKITRLGEGVPI